MDEGLFLMDEQRKWFLEMRFTPRENAMNVVVMTTKDFKLLKNLVDKAVVGYPIVLGLVPG